jgi:HTH-type transcriptional regulator / antitoxin HigA
MTEALKIPCEPPGFYIKEELDARGWEQVDLAYVLQMSPQQLNPILSGKNSITASLAVRLGDAFDMPPEFFSNLQKDYDLSRVSSDPGVRTRAKWQSAYPLREMIRRSWIEDTDASFLDVQMLRFFEASQMNDVPYIGKEATPVAHAAKKATYSTTSPEQLVWLYRVRQIARGIQVPKYSRDRLLNAIEELSGMLHSPNDAPHAVRMLRDAGVRCLIVEAFPGSKIDGICTWIGDEPVVAVTNRYDRLDNFWFVVRHELEHVLREHGKAAGSVTIDDDTTLSSDVESEDERVANQAASDFCVPTKQLQSLISRKGSYVSEKDIIGFSKRMMVHPSLVVGQYQFMTKRWSFLRKYLSNSVCGVRKHLLAELEGTNAIDGWGLVAQAEL